MQTSTNITHVSRRGCDTTRLVATLGLPMQMLVMQNVRIACMQPWLFRGQLPSRCWLYRCRGRVNRHLGRALRVAVAAGGEHVSLHSSSITRSAHARHDGS